MSQGDLVTVFESGSSDKSQNYDHSVRGGRSDLASRTTVLVQGLRLLLKHHGAREPIIAAMDDQIHAYLDNAPDEKMWLKRAKYVLTFPLSDYLRNERPKCPDEEFRPKGMFRKWWDNRINAYNFKNTHLWYSWLQGKRCSLPVSDEFVRSTYEEHLVKLTKEDDGDAATIKDIFKSETFLNVLENVRRAVRSSCNLSTFPETKTSTSACFESTRGLGGQNGTLRSISGLDVCLGDDLVSMKDHPIVYGRSIRYNQVIEKRSASGSEFWGDLRCEASAFRSGNLNCTIQAVLEPMKVRVISKGEALPYYNCRPLQKALHDSLRCMPPFRLIGRPLCPTDAIDLAVKAGRDDLWFSIDYSAATDGLSWAYSGKILSYLIQDLPLEDQYRALQVLGPHRLSYPDHTGKKIEFKGLQKNGQLMGSILSFPILCLANLGVYLFVTSILQAGWTDEERLSSVLVNGDDMVYAAPRDLWDIHTLVASRVGLEMSVGKAYLHKSYLNVNSTSIILDLSKEKRNQPRQVDFLNTGLFFGVRKVQARQGVGEADEDYSNLISNYATAHLSADPIKGYVSNIDTLMKGCLPGRQRDLLCEFLIHNKTDITKECLVCVKRRNGSFHVITRNLFLPVSSGGMGVTPPAGWRFKISKRDRELAYVVQCTYDLPQSESPICSFEKGDVVPAFVAEQDPSYLAPWVKIVTKDLVVERNVKFAIRMLHPRKIRLSKSFVVPNKACCVI